MASSRRRPADASARRTLVNKRPDSQGLEFLTDWLSRLSAETPHDGDADVDSVGQATALFRSLADLVPMNMLVKDAAGRLVFANRRYLELHGAGVADVLGKTDADLFPEPLAQLPRGRRARDALGRGDPRHGRALARRPAAVGRADQGPGARRRRRGCRRVCAVLGRHAEIPGRGSARPGARPSEFADGHDSRRGVFQGPEEPLHSHEPRPGGEVRVLRSPRRDRKIGCRHLYRGARPEVARRRAEDHRDRRARRGPGGKGNVGQSRGHVGLDDQDAVAQQARRDFRHIRHLAGRHRAEAAAG